MVKTKIPATLIHCILALQYLEEIGLIEVVVEFLSQSKQPPSKLSKNLNLNRNLSCNSLRSFLRKLLRFLVKEFYSVFAIGHNEDPSWMDVFDNYLHEVCDKFYNMVISGDFNLPDILWDSINSASGVNELVFIKTFHDHLLTQLNKKRTCGNNILDLVITRVPNRVNVTNTDCFQKIRGFLTDHGVIIFQFHTLIKASTKTLRFFCDYAKGDFEGLLSAINLSSIIANDDINTDWYQWKDTCLAAVSDYV